MNLNETYEHWKHLGDTVKQFDKYNKNGTDEFDIRLKMLYDCWVAIEQTCKERVQ